ncbi:MAG: RNA 2'-phosphotransferase [Anaerolineales bacterium]|jgi:putative RNA 2'-phosphotransferase
MADRRTLSKFLSLILRHRAQDFGLALDSEGFTDFEAVRDVVKQRSSEAYSDEDWQAVLDGQTDGKKRFEVVEGRIRALYGHSKVSQIEYPPVEPPDILYHGTHPQALESIRRQGLQSMKRQYVHLSRTIERAIKVGGRRTERAILLKIRACEAYRSGISFYNPEPEHFLAKAIPVDFIEFPKS